MKFSKVILIASCMTLSPLLASGAVTGNAELEKNKQLVMQVNDALEGGNFEAIVPQLSDDFIEHHPTDGEPERTKTEFVARFRKMAAQRAGQANQPKRVASKPDMVVAEGDKVLLVFKSDRPYPKDASKTYEAFRFELFRVKNGKVTDHWDTATIGQGNMGMPPANGAAPKSP